MVTWSLKAFSSLSLSRMPQGYADTDEFDKDHSACFPRVPLPREVTFRSVVSRIAWRSAPSSRIPGSEGAFQPQPGDGVLEGFEHRVRVLPAALPRHKPPSCGDHEPVHSPGRNLHGALGVPDEFPRHAETHRRFAEHQLVGIHLRTPD